MTIYKAFEQEALRLIREGRTHLSAKAIVEHLRMNTSVSDGGVQFKINNSNTAKLARMFDQLHPEYKGYFKHRQGPFKVQNWDETGQGVWV